MAQMKKLENLLESIDYETDTALYTKISTMLMELNAQNLY